MRLCIVESIKIAAGIPGSGQASYSICSFKVNKMSSTAYACRLYKVIRTSGCGLFNTSTDVLPRNPKSCNLNGNPSSVSAVSLRYCLIYDNSYYYYYYQYTSAMISF